MQESGIVNLNATRRNIIVAGVKLGMSFQVAQRKLQALFGIRGLVHAENNGSKAIYCQDIRKGRADEELFVRLCYVFNSKQKLERIAIQTNDKEFVSPFVAKLKGLCYPQGAPAMRENIFDGKRYAVEVYEKTWIHQTLYDISIRRKKIDSEAREEYALAIGALVVVALICFTAYQLFTAPPPTRSKGPTATDSSPDSIAIIDESEPAASADYGNRKHGHDESFAEFDRRMRNHFREQEAADANAGQNRPSAQPAYTETKWNNGDMPYASFFGRGHWDSDSESKLTVSNYSNCDAVVILKTASDKVIRHAFVKKNSTYTITLIPEVKCIMNVMYGNHWNTEKDNGDGNPRGGFMDNVHFSVSEWRDSFSFTTSVEGDYIVYPTYSVTLHTVPNGNFHTRTSEEEEFFKK